MKFTAPNKENHYALWDWLARNPEKEKRDWPGLKTMERLGLDIPNNYCFLCGEYNADDFNGDDCYGCPLNKGDYQASCEEGIYGKWVDAEGTVLRTKLARKIRDCWK